MEPFDHWRFFAEFCRWERAAGGPDPQIPLVAEMSRDCSAEERIWRGGVYIAVYNVPFAEVIWCAWPWERIQREHKGLLPWLETNWAGITTRVERRCVRRPEWMAAFLLGYARWCERAHGWSEMASPEPTHDYLFLWDDCQREVKFLGRYVALKLLEYLQKHCGFRIAPPDIRPRGGWSPRATLALLWPKYKAALLKGEDEETLALVNWVVSHTRLRLAEEAGLEIGLFDLQVLLCEYRESFAGRRQYPGRSHDSELGYWWKARHSWNSMDSEMLPARARLFPSAHLGELQGWAGPRKVLGTVLADYGYTWSDLRYDYRAMEANGGFARPQERKAT